MKDYHYKHLFGPAPSRRLGISLGIDLLPYKICSLNCIYCERGHTSHLTAERKKYVPTKHIIYELKRYLSCYPKLDYITFSGSGEPTLHSGIGEIINFLKSNFPKYKIALLTNGTLFYQQNLREEVKTVDLILPSLDAASDYVFHKLNRPVPGLKIHSIIEGLVSLRSIFSREIWLETFIVPGLNDSDEEISLIQDVIHHINPDKVQLNTLDRPGIKNWVKPATNVELKKIASKIDWEVEIIRNYKKRSKIASYRTDIESTVMQIL